MEALGAEPWAYGEPPRGREAPRYDRDGLAMGGPCGHAGSRSYGPPLSPPSGPSNGRWRGEMDPYAGDVRSGDRSFGYREYSARDHQSGRSFPTILGSAGGSSPSQGGSSMFQAAADGKPGGGPGFLLMLHFLGLAGFQGPGWLEKAPGYELICQVGGVAKRVRPRIPAPPPGVMDSAGVDEAALKELMPIDNNVIRLQEKLAVRLSEPATCLQVDVWEERQGMFDMSGSKAPRRRFLGQCVVPLEKQYSKRPCTWSVVGKGDFGPMEVGLLTCKYALATTPAPVRNLRLAEGGVGATELFVEWDPPTTDGGMPLRGYRVEARDAFAAGAAAGTGFLVEEPRTASAPVSARPSARLRNLRGNTSYSLRVWAVSEAGPGPAAELLGTTAPVAPGTCGVPCASPGHAARESAAQLCVEWQPPSDSGGAGVVAYRMWLRPLFTNSFGSVFPAEGWIDLGLIEHQGHPSDRQCTPIRMDALPSGTQGCLCSVAALNAAGHTGAATPEVPVYLVEPKQDRPNVYELSPGQSKSNSPESAEFARGLHEQEFARGLHEQGDVRLGDHRAAGAGDGWGGLGAAPPARERSAWDEAAPPVRGRPLSPEGAAAQWDAASAPGWNPQGRAPRSESEDLYNQALRALKGAAASTATGAYGGGGGSAYGSSAALSPGASMSTHAYEGASACCGPQYGGPALPPRGGCSAMVAPADAGSTPAWMAGRPAPRGREWRV